MGYCARIASVWRDDSIATAFANFLFLFYLHTEARWTASNAKAMRLSVYVPTAYISAIQPTLIEYSIYVRQKQRTAANEQIQFRLRTRIRAHARYLAKPQQQQQHSSRATQKDDRRHGPHRSRGRETQVHSGWRCEPKRLTERSLCVRWLSFSRAWQRQWVRHRIQISNCMSRVHKMSELWNDLETTKTTTTAAEKRKRERVCGRLVGFYQSNGRRLCGSVYVVRFHRMPHASIRFQFLFRFYFRLYPSTGLECVLDTVRVHKSVSNSRSLPGYNNNNGANNQSMSQSQVTELTIARARWAIPRRIQPLVSLKIYRTQSQIITETKPPRQVWDRINITRITTQYQKPIEFVIYTPPTARSFSNKTKTRKTEKPSATPSAFWILWFTYDRSFFKN